MGITSLFMYLFACHFPPLSLAHAHQPDHRFHENRICLFQNHISVPIRVHALNSCWWRMGEQANTQEGGGTQRHHPCQPPPATFQAGHALWDVLGFQGQRGATGRYIKVSFCKNLIEKENIFLLPLATSNQRKGLTCIYSVLRIVLSAMIHR